MYSNSEREAELVKCSQCGQCLAKCPIYQETLTETGSPRGRLALIRALVEGKLEPSKGYTKYIFDCTDCIACTEACPAGIKINELILDARAKIEPKPSRTEKLILNEVVSYPGRLNFLMNLGRLYQYSGLRRFVRGLNSIHFMNDRLMSFEYMLPKVPGKDFVSTVDSVIPAEGQRKYRVGYFVGCAQNVVFTSVARATVGILTKNSCEVVIPKQWQCCGMPHLGYGELEEVKRLARNNIDCFDEAGVEVIVTDCATCGSTLKEYGDLLRDDPEYSTRATAFSHKVLDATEFLTSYTSFTSESHPNPIKGKATYHDPCHLVRAQGVRSQPRELIRNLMGENFIEMRDSDVCCGGAGTYGITHYDTSMRILNRKMSNIQATGADTVITTCPGCMIQLGLGIQRFGLDARVVHLVELVYQALTEEGQGLDSPKLSQLSVE